MSKKIYGQAVFLLIEVCIRRNINWIIFKALRLTEQRLMDVASHIQEYLDSKFQRVRFPRLCDLSGPISESTYTP